MSETNESYLFDATNYLDFEKAMALRKRLTRPPELLWIKGVPITIICIVVTVWFILSGDADEEPFLLFAFVFITVIVAAATINMVYGKSDDPRVPVRLTSSGYLVLGKRRWPVDRIGRIIAYGCSGAVDIKDKDGHTLALPYRVQFGSFDDFMQVLRRLRPDLDVEREATNVKVRVPQERD